MILRLFTFFLFIVCAAAPAPSSAQNKEILEHEKAIFAFFNLTRTQPDYQQWIKNSERYMKAPDQRQKDEIYEIENLRLKWGMGTYDIEGDFIKIRTPIKLAVTGTQKDGVLSFAFPDAGADNVPYFPFPYGNETIALIVSDLDKFLSVPLTAEQFAAATAALKPNTAYEGDILLRVKAVKADNQAPMTLDGLNQWLMMGETGYLELIYTPPGGTEQVLWSFMAPWYLSDTERELFPLFGK